MGERGERTQGEGTRLLARDGLADLAGADGAQEAADLVAHLIRRGLEDPSARELRREYVVVRKGDEVLARITVELPGGRP